MGIVKQSFLIVCLNIEIADELQNKTINTVDGLQNSYLE
jgi:hypothetical protein